MSLGQFKGGGGGGVMSEFGLHEEERNCLATQPRSQAYLLCVGRHVLIERGWTEFKGSTITMHNLEPHEDQC